MRPFRTSLEQFYGLKIGAKRCRRKVSHERLEYYFFTWQARDDTFLQTAIPVKSWCLAEEQLKRGPESPLEHSAAWNLVGAYSEVPLSTSAWNGIIGICDDIFLAMGQSWRGDLSQKSPGTL